MSYHNWLEAGEIVDKGVSYQALVFAIFEMCPRDELGRMKQAFPKHWNEFQYRAKRPDGILPTDPVNDTGITSIRPMFSPVGDDYPPEFVRKGNGEEEG